MKGKLFISLIMVLVLSVLLLGGCRNTTTVTTTETPLDPFTTTWSLGEEGRTFSISGNSVGHLPGKISEFLLIINNQSGSEDWQGEYCILLVDKDGVVAEIKHEQFNIPIGLETQQPVIVEFPGGFEGPLGLCVVIPQRASLVTTIWVGTGRTGNAGPWPNIKTCPHYLTEETARQIAADFVRNDPTFLFDGIADTLTLVETLNPGAGETWQFIYRFESAHAGYGDRTGQMLAEVITPHEAVITVVPGKVAAAVMDGKWDMLKQQLLGSIEINLAPIHEVEVYLMKSNPPQVGVRIKGGLSDGCTTFHDAVVTREGNTVTVTVTVQKPAGSVCPAIYTFFEENLNLGSDFTFGTTYILKVNDFTTTFDYS